MGLYTVRLLGRADRVADGKGIVARTLNTLSAGRSMGGAPAGEHLVLINTLMVAPARSGSTPAAFSATTRFRSSGAAVRLGAGGESKPTRLPDRPESSRPQESVATLSLQSFQYASRSRAPRLSWKRPGA